MPVSKRTRAVSERPSASVEWIGGQFSPPVFVGTAEPYRPVMAVWLEMPSGLIVGSEVDRPDRAADAVSRSLREAMKRPASGPPRRPDRIRVPTPELAEEIRGALGDSVPITVAPTPELDQLFELMVERMPDGDLEPSYLEHGRVSPEAVDRLFVAAGVLHRIAPWKVIDDTDVLRMDIPALGVDGACVSIVGALGKSRGVLIFPSLEGFLAFLDAAERPLPKRGRMHLGTSWLALNYEREADIPPGMRAEAKEHDWPVAGRKAWPRVQRCEPDGALPPADERDVAIVTACAGALAAFTIRNGEAVADAESEPICESCFDEHDREVRFTLPYEAFPLFDVEAAPEPHPDGPSEPAAPRVGRNEPCPCGSGRKYKKCHGRTAAEPRRATPDADPRHVLDARCVDRLLEFAVDRFGMAFLRSVRPFSDPTQATQLARPWSVYGYVVEGATVVDHYLEEHGRTASRKEREWLEAQRAAWLSIWEVTAVEPGASVDVRDLLTGATRRVREVSGSETFVVHDTFLGRVVDTGDVSVLCGVHPRPLPPIEGNDVVGAARRKLRRKSEVPVERLRAADVGPHLIRQWERAVARFDEWRATPPVLTNTDGDPLLVTVDHFDVAPGTEAEVRAHLAAMEDVAPPEPHEEPPAFVFRRSRIVRGEEVEAIVVGVARLAGAELRIETNSIARADALRARVEAACGARLRHRAREHSDPLSTRRPQPTSPPEPPDPELEQLAREAESRQRAAWLDESIPLLGGLTPRQAVRTREGRTAVDLLLKSFENQQRRARPDAPFDISDIRRELRLD